MGTVNIKSDFKDNFDKIWNSSIYSDIEFKNRGYAIEDKLIKGGLLFIGLNPSFKKGLEDPTNKHSFYPLNQGNKTHKYFNKFEEISKEVEMYWSHHDLLFLRETKQKNIEKLISSEPGLSFVVEQLSLSKRILEESNPKIIIVNNSLARRFLGQEKIDNKNIWMGYDFDFDDEIGTYRIVKNKALENTPIFFTSMLTGQRALDKGSYERLIWHIKFVQKMTY